MKVQCPKCKNSMMYQPNSKDLAGKKKRCVYCGHTFLILTDKGNRII